MNTSAKACSEKASTTLVLTSKRHLIKSTRKGMTQCTTQDPESASQIQKVMKQRARRSNWRVDVAN